jgi:hypothetical protein
LARVAGALLALVLVAGCGGGDDKKSSPKSSSSQASTPQSTSTTPSGKVQATPEKAIASRDASMDHKPVKLEIIELKRSGATTALTFRLTATNSDDSAQVAQTFDDGIDQKIKSATNQFAGGSTVDGISLIDTKNRKRYLVGRDEDGACVCDTELSSAFANSDAPLLLSATYAAPPQDVRAVDVVIPHFGTFKDVPIS